MRKLLGLALLLGVVQFLAGAAVSLLIFRKVDLRFQAFLGFVAIPLFQAVILLWVRRDAAARPMRDALRSLRNVPLLTILAADLAALIASLFTTPDLARDFYGLHALLAAAALLFALRLVPGPRQWIAALAAAGLAAYGVSFFADWVRLLPTLVDDGRTIVRWSSVYVPLFVAALAGLLAAAWALETRAARAAGWVDIAAGLFVLAAIVVGSNIFFHPSLTPAWRVVHRVLAYTTVTAMLLAAASLLAARKEAAGA